MIVNDAMFVLRAVDEAARADLVDQARSAAGEAEHIFDRRLFKHVVLGTGVAHVPGYVCVGLRPVEMSQLALQIDSLANRRVGLQHKAVPQLALPNQNKRHGALSIHLEVEQEADFFKHLAIQQMRFVDDDNGLQPVNAAHEFDLPMQLALGVAAVELRFAAQLLEQTLVEVPRHKLRVRQVQHLVCRRVENLGKPANRHLAGSAVAGGAMEALLVPNLNISLEQAGFVGAASGQLIRGLQTVFL